MTNKNKKEKQSILQKELNAKEVLGVLGVCALIFVYGYIFVYPRYTQYKAASSNLASLEEQVSDYESQINEMPQKQEQLNSLEEELRIKSAIINHDMEDGMFLIGLSKLMEDINIDLVDYSVEETTPYNTFNAIPMSISLRGNYLNIREIMYYMEEQKNMTQILDYNVETFIDEENGDTEETVVKTPNPVVHWTKSGTQYHTDTCIVLDNEKTKFNESSLSGTATQSQKTTACDSCKPYTETIVQNEEIVEDNRSKGEVEATFKFIVYTSENPKFELNNEDSTKWNPGKYNPFTTTSR